MGLADGTTFEVFLEGAGFPDPEAEEAARTEEEADRVVEADPPPVAEAEEPRGGGQERGRAEGASTSRPSSRPWPQLSRPPQRRATPPPPPLPAAVGGGACGLTPMKLLHLRFVCGVATDVEVPPIWREVAQAPTKGAALSILHSRH